MIKYKINIQYIKDRATPGYGDRQMAGRIRAGIVGATGMVGQRFITLLENHPYFEVTALAASARSAGAKYTDAVGDAADITAMKEKVDFIFCAVDMKKDAVVAMEEAYAKAELPVISNNSANRWTPDVPMLIPEINDAHAAVIADQKKRLGTQRGVIAVKPTCSIHR